jgi:hypothetical protein
MITSNIKSADANAGLLLELDAILAVTLGGTSLAGGKFSLAGSVIGALIIQTLTYTIYPSACRRSQHGGQVGRRVCDLRIAVGRVQNHVAPCLPRRTRR